MGGGHVSRPDFGMPQPDPSHPLTEFYCLLQRALDREGVFALPALYAQFRAPARRIYADEAADFLTLLPDEEEGASRLLAPAQLQLLYSSLHVMPDGAPAALLLTEECTRTVYAVQLLPPFVWEDPLPPLPDAPAALSLTLTMRDVEEIDACPAALGHRLACGKAGKRWLHHPRAETYLSEPSSSGSTDNRTEALRVICQNMAANGPFVFGVFMLYFEYLVRCRAEDFSAPHHKLQ